MLAEELLELADSVRKMKAEMQTVEVKSAHQGCPRRLYDTLSAFANQDTGGVILFGLNEKSDFAVAGVYDLQDLQKKVTEQCLGMIPPVRATFTSVQMEGKTICCAEIPPADVMERPCYYSGAGRTKGSYVRAGDADLPMTDYEIYSYESFRRHVRDDERTYERASISFLDREMLQAYLNRMREEHPKFSKLSEEQALEMLAITRDGVPTLAAILNFGIYPQGYFKQLVITAITVPGTQIGDTGPNGERFLDNRRIEGTLSEMLQDAILFCTRNMKVRTIIDPQTGMRTDHTEYPIEAIREAVLNALIHRDYSHFTEGTPIQIDFFSDRLEIHSPGTLYGRMTVEDLGKARPDLRNPALAAMAEFMLKTENRYSGIPTIRREMKAAGLPPPVFLNGRNEFVVVLYNTVQEEPSAPEGRESVHSESDLLGFCSVPRSRQEIAGFLGLKTSFYITREYLQPLIDSGKLVMTIPDKPRSRNQKYVAKKTAVSKEGQE